MAAYKILLLAFPIVAFSQQPGDAMLMPITVLEPLAIGAATGFISDGPEVMSCGYAVIGEFGELKTALLDLKKGIMSFNVTEIEDALHEFQAAINGSQGASCKVVGTDMKALISAIKQVPRQPKDFVIHILSNFFDDGDKIFGELAASEKAYKTGHPWEFMTAGHNLGMALRRMLVGELNGTVPAPPMPPSALEPFVIGMASGFISDSPDVMPCGMAVMGEVNDLKIAAKDLKKGITTFNVTEFEDALHEIKAAIDGSKAVKTTCKVVEANVTAIVQALKQIHGPKDLVIHIVNNLFNDGERIFDGLAAAESASKAGSDYMTVGQELGKVFRRLLVGETAAKSKAGEPAGGSISADAPHAVIGPNSADLIV